MKDNMKDGLKWVVLVFVAALLILLLVSQKDKFVKVTGESAVNVDSSAVQNSVVEKVDEISDEVASGTDSIVEALQDAVEGATDTVEEIVDTTTGSVELDENGVEVAPR